MLNRYTDDGEYRTPDINAGIINEYKLKKIK